VLELHAIASKKAEGGGRFAVAMTAQENGRFLKGIREDHKLYYSMLGRVNAEASDCSRAADRESIHEDIRRSVGFAKLSRMVFGVMEGWMEEELKGQAAACAAAGDEAAAMDWNVILASVFAQQGRHNDAIVIFEADLEYRQRVMPENHPHIGVMRLRLLMCVCVCVCVYIHIYIYIYYVCMYVCMCVCVYVCMCVCVYVCMYMIVQYV
jgi:hypothetical protein